MSNQSNPFFNFDVTKIVESFNFGPLSDQAARFTDTDQFPGLDLEAMMQIQRNNIETITAANTAIVDSMQSYASIQAEFFQKSFEQATQVFANYSGFNAPADNFVKPNTEAPEARNEDGIDSPAKTTAKPAPTPTPVKAPLKTKPITKVKQKTAAKPAAKPASPKRKTARSNPKKMAGKTTLKAQPKNGKPIKAAVKPAVKPAAAPVLVKTKSKTSQPEQVTAAPVSVPAPVKATKVPTPAVTPIKSKPEIVSRDTSKTVSKPPKK